MKTLARKYRPPRIKDLLGQDALVRMISFAIENNSLSQAYIFTGVRGTGKTTSARIIAKSINCHEGMSIEPCGQCPSCREIASGSSLDVIELDAASKSGVNDIRELLETISYAPMTPGARKIYIIDEAHMLSTAAWNALLKTLEEPPAHVIFMFATTEQHKIPATISSRCQTFNLRRIDATTVATHLENIAAQETAILEPGVAMTIAHAGEGSMRDSISILDQAISGSADKIVKMSSVLSMLGKASKNTIISLLSAIVDGNLQNAVSDWRSIIDAGVDPIGAVDDLMELLHQCALIAVNPDLLKSSDLTDTNIADLVQLTTKTTFGHLAGAQKMLIEMRSFAVSNPNQPQAVEILVMRLVAGFSRRKKD